MGQDTNRGPSFPSLFMLVCLVLFIGYVVKSVYIQMNVQEGRQFEVTQNVDACVDLVPDESYKNLVWKNCQMAEDGDIVTVTSLNGDLHRGGRVHVSTADQKLVWVDSNYIWPLSR